MAPKDAGPPERSKTQKAAVGRPTGVSFTDYGNAALRLLDNGYAPLPLALSQKRPALQNWADVLIDVPTVERWATRYLRPILVENDGWALFIYTPRGRNHGHATYLRALEADTWFCEKLTVDDTGLITPAQIEEERRAGMSDGKIGQEFFCSFDADIDEQLISHDLVSAAMARQATAESWEEKVIGVDVARFGDDKSALYFRHGRDGNPRPYERYAGLDTMALAAKVAERISTWSPDAVFVDDGGVGGGVVDRLHQLGFDRVIGVNFGGKADRGGAGLRAGNKRSEMWLAAREWLQRGALPRDELLAAELTAPMYAYNAANALMLEPKADMKRRGIPSPDVADAFALTFAYAVQRWEEETEPEPWTGRSLVTGY